MDHKPINAMMIVSSHEEPMLEMLDFTIRIGSTPNLLYLDLCLYTATQHTIRLFHR